MEILAIMAMVLAVLSSNFDGTPRPSAEAVPPPPTTQGGGPLPQARAHQESLQQGRTREYGADVACRWKSDGSVTKIVAIRMGTEEIHAGSVDHATGEVTLLRQNVVAGGLILKPKNFAGEACDWEAARLTSTGKVAVRRIIDASRGLGKSPNVAGGE